MTVLRFPESREPRISTPDRGRTDVVVAEPTRLSVPIEETRFCATCLQLQAFIADRECDLGLLGKCQGCGEEFFRPFTRTIAS